jgi:hypothetical protein
VRTTAGVRRLRHADGSVVALRLVQGAAPPPRRLRAWLRARRWRMLPAEVSVVAVTLLLVSSLLACLHAAVHEGNAVEAFLRSAVARAETRP